MKKMKSTLVNMVGVLVGVALIMGGILAFVNNMTKEPIRLQAEKTLQDGIKAVMMSDNLKVTATDTITQSFDSKDYEFIVHKTVDEKGGALGSAVETTTLGFGGDLKVLVGFNPQGEILGYTLLEHAETPGLGAKADAWFQKDGKGCIIGKDPKQPLQVKKDTGNDADVDAITASTITTRAFLKAVNQAYTVYMQANQEVVSQEEAKVENF